MSLAPAIQCAQDVVDLLNAGTFTQTFTAARRIVPRYTKEELVNLTVSVIAVSLDNTFLARNTEDGMVSVQVGVQKALSGPIGEQSNENLPEFDSLTTLVDSMTAYLEGDGVGGTRRSLAGGGRLQKVNVNLFDDKHLLDDQIFTSIITLTYYMSRAIR